MTKYDPSDPGNPLRSQLPRLTDSMTPDENVAKIDAMRATFRHTIKMHGVGEGTCGTYAFDLWTDGDYIRIARHLNIYAGEDFFDWVAQRLEALPSAEVGALVMYWLADEPKHVGLVIAVDKSTPPRIRSKWGSMPVYDHGLFEVTIDYGDEARFFRLPDAGGVKQLFLEYADWLAGELLVDLARYGPMDIRKLTLDEFLLTNTTAAPALIDFYSAIATPYANLVGRPIRALQNGYVLHEVQGQHWNVLLLDGGNIVGAYVGELLAVDDAYRKRDLTVPLVLAAVDRRPLPRGRKLVPGGRAALTKAWRVAHGQLPNPWP